MTDILKKNFENFRNVKYKSALDILEETFRKFGIDFYLIGAMSRDLWTENVLHLPRFRATLDLDFAICINDYNIYEQIIECLIENKFEKTNYPYRFMFENTIIDLLPFGEIEKNGNVTFKSNPPLTLSMLSYDEVTRHSIKLSDNFQTVTLPGLCIMKLVSYYDSPDKRAKDIDDFIYILENYFNIFTDNIIENFSTLIAEYNNAQIAGSVVLGKEMKSIFGENGKLKSIIVNSLNKQISPNNEIEINEMYESDPENSQFRKWKLILELKKEIEYGI